MVGQSARDLVREAAVAVGLHPFLHGEVLLEAARAHLSVVLALSTGSVIHVK